MAKHYDVYNNETKEVVTDFELLKDAQLWVAEQENPSKYEVIVVDVHDCSPPMNIFLSHGTLTRNKK